MKHTLTWGGILGLVLIAFSLGLYLLGMTEEKWVQWISYLLIGGIIFLALKAKRTDLGGFMSFGQGLGSGTGIGLIGGILAAVYTYILFTAIDPGLLEEMILRAEDEMYNSGTPDEQIEMAMEYVEKFMQPGIMSFFVVLVYAISGFVASLICSGILQKTDPSFESNFK